MASFVVSIPSLGRANDIGNKTIRFLDREGIPAHLVTVYVVDEEIADYKSALAEFESKGGNIISGRRGLPQQRDFAMERHDEGQHILFLDDDVESWDKSLSPIAENKTLLEFIEYAFEHCHEKKSFIWSVNPSGNKFHREHSTDIQYKNLYLIGAFYGIINRESDLHRLNNVTANEKEDVRRSLNYFINDGVIVRFGRIGFKTEYFCKKGGGMGNRDSRIESSRIQTLKILEDYPNMGTMVVRDKGKNKGITEFKFNWRATPENIFLEATEGKPKAPKKEKKAKAVDTTIVESFKTPIKPLVPVADDDLTEAEITAIYDSTPNYIHDPAQGARSPATRTKLFASTPVVTTNVNFGALSTIRKSIKVDKIQLETTPEKTTLLDETTTTLDISFTSPNSGNLSDDLEYLEEEYRSRVRLLQKQMNDLSLGFSESLKEASKYYLRGKHLKSGARPSAIRTLDGERILRHSSTDKTIRLLPPVDAKEFEWLYCELNKTKLKVQKTRGRGFPPHENAILGISLPKVIQGKHTEFGKIMGVAQETQKRPMLYAEILRIGELVCPPDFQFNTITLNKNTDSPRHQDANNTGESVLVSFGEYTGSHICIEHGSEDNLVKINTRHQPVLFDGSALFHYNSKDLERSAGDGNKYSLVFYTRNNEYLRL